MSELREDPHKVEFKARRPFRIALGARVKSLAWAIPSKLIFGLVCIGILMEGLKCICPPLGQKLHKMPLLGSLQSFEETHRLDLSLLFAIAIMVTVWCLWADVLRVLLHRDKYSVLAPKDKFILVVGAIVLCTDAAIFYLGIAELTWGGGLSFTALLMTVAYVCVLVFLSYVSLKLKMEVQNAEAN